MKPQTKHRMIQAQNYIKRGDYNRARFILLQLDEPMADKWLVKLNRIDPDYSEATDYRLMLFCLFTGVSISVAFYILFPGRVLAIPLIAILTLLIYSILSKHYKR